MNNQIINDKENNDLNNTNSSVAETTATQKPNNETINTELNKVDKQIEKIPSSTGKVLDNNSITQEKFNEVVKSDTKKNRIKSAITSLILLGINITIVVILASALFKSAGDSSLSSLIIGQGSKLNYLWYCILLFFICMIADSIFFSLLLKANIGKFRPLTCFKTSAIGKYYEAITPLAAGGQPAQILYLSKRKVSPGVSTSLPVIRVTLLNFVTIIIALLMFIFVVPKILPSNIFIDILSNILRILAYVGLFINVLYLLAMFIMANSKIFGKILARNIIKLGYSLKIVKNYRTSYKKLMGQVIEFQACFKYLGKHFWLLIGLVVCVLFEVLSLACIPAFVTIALSDITFVSNLQFWTFIINSIALYYVCYMASSFIPLPGGTGMMEISFVILFGQFMTSSYIVWAFLIWRLASYYLVIIQGFIITVIDSLKSMFIKSKSNTLSHKTNIKS